MAQNSRLKTEICQQIAQRIALDGCDWQTARQNTLEAIAETMGKIPTNALPSSSEIETEVRACFALYSPEEHARTLTRKRLWAKRILQRLSSFDIYLAGAVLNGSATEQSNICFELFCDDVKSVEVALFDSGIDFQAIDPLGGQMPKPSECLGFLISDRKNRVTEGVRIDIYETYAKRFQPYKHKPDAFQQPWEAMGRISLDQLVKNMQFDD